MQAALAFNAEVLPPSKDEPVPETEDEGKGDFWKLDKTIPISFLYVVLTGFVLGVLWVGNLSWTVSEHTKLLSAINATVQARVPAMATVESLSQQVGNLSSTVNSLAAANQRLTAIERDIFDLRAAANNTATHERRIEMLEESYSNTTKILGEIGGRLARIEAKLDVMQPSGPMRSH